LRWDSQDDVTSLDLQTTLKGRPFVRSEAHSGRKRGQRYARNNHVGYGGISLALCSVMKDLQHDSKQDGGLEGSCRLTSEQVFDGAGSQGSGHLRRSG
jgi:hypothetical protein